MKVDVLASYPHYAAHLAPIWWALPAETRGHFYAAGDLANVDDGEGLPGWRYGYPPDTGRPCLVAGYIDEASVPGPVIYVEHGAGQTYNLDGWQQGAVGYSGSEGHDRVVLFLCPHRSVAARWRVAYPDVPAVAVGCPRLDGWHRRMLHDREARVANRAQTVAITFHSEAPVCAETFTAWTEYATMLPAAARQLAARGWHVLGTGHPRLWRKIGPWWRANGVEAVQNFDEVLARADVLCFDNTSAGPEFASTGRPVVFMNSSVWRRHVHHGGRFWDWPVGQVSVDNALQLPDAVEAAYADPPEQRAARQRMVDSVYVACDGHAAERAAKAVLSLAATRA